MPSVAVMLTLMVVPLVATIWLGFQRLTLRDLQNPEFIGLQNYRDLLSDPEFWTAARWTILLVIIVRATEGIEGTASIAIPNLPPGYAK